MCQTRTVFHSSCPSSVQVPNRKHRVSLPSLWKVFCFSLCCTHSVPGNLVWRSWTFPPSCAVLETCLGSSHSLLLPLAGLSTVQPWCLRGMSYSRWQHCPNFELCDTKSLRRGFTATPLQSHGDRWEGRAGTHTQVGLRDPRLVLCLLREPHTAQGWSSPQPGHALYKQQTLV